MIPRGPLLLLTAALLVLPACSDGDDTAQTGSGSTTANASPSGPTTSSSAPAEATEPVVEISVSVRDGKVKPKTRRVEVAKDSQLRLIVTSDVDDQLHVHGFEIDEEIEAGRPTTVEFVADQQGVFEVETHETELQLLQLEVR